MNTRGQNEENTGSWIAEVLFNGQCPLCHREINLLKRLDRRNQILSTEIAASDFAAEDYRKSMNDFMSEFHGRLPEGQWIVGVEVFRQLYAAIGLGAIVWITRLPLVSHGLGLGYRLFAKHRLRLTGRCTTDGTVHD